MQEIELNVVGMTCGGCVRSVTRILSGLDGVGEVSVSLEQASARVSYDSRRVQPAHMMQALAAGGFEGTLPST